MSQDPPTADYLDALFAAIRAFADELEASRRWAGRAEATENQVWRLRFLRESRLAFERTPARLATIGERLRALGAADELPAPLDQVQRNLAKMRAELEAHGAWLTDFEARVVQAAAPIGRA